MNRRLLSGSLAALAGGVVAIGTVIVLGEEHVAALARSCGLPRPPVPAAMLPLGVASVVLALISVALAVVAVRAETGRRFGYGDALLAVAGVLLVLFSAYFGVAAVLMEPSAGTVACGG